MKKYKILFLVTLFLLAKGELIYAQYNVMLRISNELAQKYNKSKETLACTKNTVCNFEEMEEIPSANLVKNKIFPTYTDVFKVAATPKSNFVYLTTRSEFPYRINQFVRNQIVVSKSESGKITAVYKLSDESNKKSYCSVRFIPAGFGTEGRLRDAFLKNMSTFSEELKFSQQPKIETLRYKGKLYNSIGVRGVFKGKENSFSSITFYECGSWLLEVKIVDFYGDLSEYQNLHNELVQVFNPSQLTAVNPLYDRPNLDFNSDGLKEPLVTGALWAAAMKKIDWASSQVALRERAAGFPDLYLNMHLEAVKEFLKVQANKPNLQSNSKVWNYYNDLLSISNAGFLSEYIMEQYDRVMIVPSNIHLNFEAYHQWKKDRDIKTDIRKKLYNISYRNLPY